MAQALPVEIEEINAAIENVLEVIYHLLIDRVEYTDQITIAEMALVLGEFH
jgi:hypothetical protein